MSNIRHRLRIFLAQHLFLYLAVIVGVSGAISILIARDDIRTAWDAFDRRWLPLILGLSLFNYLLRFVKWQWMLRAVDLRIPVLASARIYFACFSMVVTPFRLGEFYKLVFLKRLHGASLRRSAPVLLVERISDAIAVLALASVYFDRHLPLALSFPATLLLSLLIAHLAANEAPRRQAMSVLRRLPLLNRRADALDRALEHNSSLLELRRFLPILLLSAIAWSSECMGLWVLLRALGTQLPLADAAWIYAASTALGNVTFLPGGLGSTELTMAGLLLNEGIARSTTLPATLLVRAATLWFAVVLGLLVTLFGRRALRWRDVQADAAAES